MKEMEKHLGFIGCGNMAGAIIGGIVAGGRVAAENITASDILEENLKKANEAHGIAVTFDNKETARTSDILVLSVKPQFYMPVIGEIRDEIKTDAVIVTIAPGISLQAVGDAFGRPVKVVRTMPNTPALVGAGMTGACANDLVTDEEMATVLELFGTFSRVEIVPERLMDVVGAVGGAAPAYVFMLIEAMADAAVSDGMPRAQAYRFAGQTVMGSAKLLLETGRHPGELKDMVCSPGGTTIEGVRRLEAGGFRSAIFEALKAVTEKSKTWR